MQSISLAFLHSPILVRIGFACKTNAVAVCLRQTASLAHRFCFTKSTVTTCFQQVVRTSPRTISTVQLHMLPHFHLQPINRIVSPGPYFFRMGNLISKGASRLDAFSVYPVRTWLPCHALGRTTGAPAVRPSRSSRTKDSSPQISSARDR